MCLHRLNALAKERLKKVPPSVSDITGPTASLTTNIHALALQHGKTTSSQPRPDKIKIKIPGCRNKLTSSHGARRAKERKRNRTTAVQSVLVPLHTTPQQPPPGSSSFPLISQP